MMSKLSCSIIIDGKVVKAHEMVPLANVIIIDTIELSRNDRRIRIRATDGDYVFNLNGALNVIEDMLTEHGFWRADNSNLINMAHVDKVVDAMFKPEVLFVNTDIRGQIAAIKVRALRKLFPEVSIVKNA